MLPQIVASVVSRPGAGTIDLTLDPPELGRIEIALEVVDTVLKATLSVERASTGEAIRRHSEQLMQQFQEAGFENVDLAFAEHGHRDHRRAPGDAANADRPVADGGAAHDGRAGVPPVRAVAHGRMDLRL